MSEEKWKEVVFKYKDMNCDLKYMISNYGRLRNEKTEKIVLGHIRRNERQFHSFYRRKHNKRINIPTSRLVATAWIPNPENKPIVDHVDRNPLNNKISNLRWATVAENQWNSSGRVKARSTAEKIYKGCHLQKDMDRPRPWRARIVHKGKYINIGLFYTQIQAALAYNKKAVELFGEFACLNKISKKAVREDEILVKKLKASYEQKVILKKENTRLRNNQKKREAYREAKIKNKK